jgi:predicted nucleotidyltransferase/HEPN domain-containing protein
MRRCDALVTLAMRTDLDHLPAAKRDELVEVVRILFAEFEDALAGRNAPHRKAGRILKIILFGSYARGNWVADPVGRYFSDYDLLVVVNHDDLADLTEYWAQADDRLVREHVTGGRLQTPVNFIVHSLDDVNAQLRRGRPFFVDAVRDGIALYEAPDHPFGAAKRLPRVKAQAEARSLFEEWFPPVAYALERARRSMADGEFRFAAFDLHQAAERLYHCTSLVLTLYSPKSHKLNFLRSQAERLAPSLIAAWPRDTRFSQRAFDLLRRAYVDARYSPHYRIEEAELDWLLERASCLADLVREECERHLEGSDDREPD